MSAARVRRASSAAWSFLMPSMRALVRVSSPLRTALWQALVMMAMREEKWPEERV